MTEMDAVDEIFVIADDLMLEDQTKRSAASRGVYLCFSIRNSRW